MIASRKTFGRLNCVIVDGGPSPTVPVVLCHGYGAPGTDLVPLGEYVMDMLGDQASDYRIVFPEAPLSLASEGMPGGRAWWRLNMQRLMELFETNDFSELRREQPPGIDEAREQLVETIDAVVASIDSPGPLVIGGFSQGAMITMDVALRGLKTAPAGLILFSGTLICEAVWQSNVSRLSGTRVLQSHGRSDFVLPFVAAEWLRAMIEPAAASYEFIDFDGSHTIPLEALEATAKLLLSVR